MTAPDTNTPAGLTALAEEAALAAEAEAMARGIEGMCPGEALTIRTPGALAALLRRLAAALPKPVSDDAREEIASVLEQVARDGLPQPRDLDAAIDAILSILAGD